MKLRHIVPALGLAALLTVGCAQSLSASSERDTELSTETSAAECSSAKSCCPSEAAQACTEEQKAACAEKKAECAEKKECPVSDESSGS